MSKQDGNTALIWAFREEHESVASVLVAAGAGVDIQDKVSTRIGCVYILYRYIYIYYISCYCR